MSTMWIALPEETEQSYRPQVGHRPNAKTQDICQCRDAERKHVEHVILLQTTSPDTTRRTRNITTNNLA